MSFDINKNCCVCGILPDRNDSISFDDWIVCLNCHAIISNKLHAEYGDSFYFFEYPEKLKILRYFIRQQINFNLRQYSKQMIVIK